MAANELGRDMRRVFEATMPKDEVILRKHHALALERAFGTKRSRSGAARAGAFLAAAGVLLVWAMGWDWLAPERRVEIRPSLERDLRPPPAAEASQVDDSAVAPAAVSSADREARAAQSRPSQVVRVPARSLERATPSAQATRPSTETDGTEADWARVTEAMRRRDWSGAQGALAPLLASEDGETRDSARLVRIRVEISSAPERGKEVALLAELKELSETGSSSSIRASARRLHGELTDDALTDESKHPREAGELPLQEE